MYDDDPDDDPFDPPDDCPGGSLAHGAVTAGCVLLGICVAMDLAALLRFLFGASR